MKAGAVGLSIALLIACDSSAVAASGDSERLLIEVSGEPCTARIDGVSYDTTAQATAALGKLSDTDRSVLIEGPYKTPWRCVGGLIFVLQSRGFSDIRPSFRNVSEIDWSAAAVPANQNEHPEARPYDEDRVAAADVDAALARAAARDVPVLLVLGANWCHDSRSLAGWFETPRFAAMIAAKYELVYVDVGHPQGGEGRNLDIAQRFGIDEITGTPNVLIVSPAGELLNADTATTWNDAASRSESAIFSYFDGLR